MSRRRNKNLTILVNKVRWEGSPTFELPIGLGRAPNINCWSCRVDSWDKTKAEAEIDPWSPQVWRRFAQRLTRFTVLESLFNDTRSFKNPCKTAHDPSNSFYLHHGCHPIKGWKFFLGQLSFLSLQIRFAMRCSHHLQFYAEKGGWKGWGSELHPRRLSVSSYTAFGHSDSIQANKSQVIIMRMRAPASPPRHTILAFHTVLRGWAFWGVETIVWAFHTLWVGDESMLQQITIYYPESHCSCFAIISTVQSSSIDVNQSGWVDFIWPSSSPSWLTASLFHRVNLNLASRGHITTRSWSNLIFLPEYHLCGALWLNQISQFNPSSLPARTTSSGTTTQAHAWKLPKLQSLKDSSAENDLLPNGCWPRNELPSAPGSWLIWWDIEFANLHLSKQEVPSSQSELFRSCNNRCPDHGKNKRWGAGVRDWTSHVTPHPCKVSYILQINTG